MSPCVTFATATVGGSLETTPCARGPEQAPIATAAIVAAPAASEDVVGRFIPVASAKSEVSRVKSLETGTGLGLLLVVDPDVVDLMPVRIDALRRDGHRLAI